MEATDLSIKKMLLKGCVCIDDKKFRITIDHNLVRYPWHKVGASLIDNICEHLLGEKILVPWGCKYHSAYFYIVPLAEKISDNIDLNTFPYEYLFTVAQKSTIDAVMQTESLPVKISHCVSSFKKMHIPAKKLVIPSERFFSLRNPSISFGSGDITWSQSMTVTDVPKSLETIPDSIPTTLVPESSQTVSDEFEDIVATAPQSSSTDSQQNVNQIMSKRDNSLVRCSPVKVTNTAPKAKPNVSKTPINGVAITPSLNTDRFISNFNPKLNQNAYATSDKSLPLASSKPSKLTEPKRKFITHWTMPFKVHKRQNSFNNVLRMLRYPITDHITPALTAINPTSPMDRFKNGDISNVLAQIPLPNAYTKSTLGHTQSCTVLSSNSDYVEASADVVHVAVPHSRPVPVFVSSFTQTSIIPSNSVATTTENMNPSLASVGTTTENSEATTISVETNTEVLPVYSISVAVNTEVSESKTVTVETNTEVPPVDSISVAVNTEMLESKTVSVETNTEVLSVDSISVGISTEISVLKTVSVETNTYFSALNPVSVGIITENTTKDLVSIGTTTETLTAKKKTKEGVSTGTPLIHGSDVVINNDIITMPNFPFPGSKRKYERKNYCNATTTTRKSMRIAEHTSLKK